MVKSKPSTRSRTEQFKEDTFVSDGSIQAFQEELRESEKERLQAGKRRLDLLQSVRNQFHEKDSQSAILESKGAEERVFHDGSIEDIENVAKRIQRELQTLQAKNFISSNTKTLFQRFQGTVTSFKEKKSLAYKIIASMTSVQENEGNSSLQKVKELQHSLKREIQRLTNDLITTYKQLDSAIFTDTESENHTKGLFYACMMELEKQQRERIIRLYRTKVQDASLEKRNAITKKIIEQLAKSNPNLVIAIHHYMRKKARYFVKHNQIPYAIKELCFAVSVCRNQIETYRMLYHLFQKTNDEHKAFCALCEIARLSPDDLQLQKKVADMWLKYGKLKNAIAIYQSLVSHSNSEIVWRKTLAYLLVQNHQYSDVPNILHPYLKIIPQDYKAKKLLGLSLEQSELYEMSINVFLELLNESPEDVECIQHLVQAYRHLHLHHDAIQLLKKAVETHPEQTAFQILLAALLQENGQSTEAENQYKTLLHTNSSSVPLLLASSKELIANHNPDVAIERLNSGLEIEPNNANLWLYLGKAKRLIEKYKEAEFALLKAEEFTNDNKELRAELMVLYSQTGQWDKLQSFQQLLKLMRWIMQGYRVLIADDERPVRKLLERICAQLGWESDAVEDGDQAVKLMDSNEYQIFTVDVNMPGPSGVELARIILKRYETPAILILTGYAEVQDAVQAMKDGVYDYVQKDNVEIEDIKAYLQNAASFYENLKLNTEANKQREKSITNLEVSHKQFQALIDLSSDMIFILDVGNLEFIDCNPAACQQLCYSREELLNSAIQTVLPMFTPEFIQDHFLHSTKKKRTIEAEITSKEGNLIDVEIDLTFLCFQHGVYLGIVIRDITERKALQAEIVQERNLLHLLMNNIPDSIYFKDKQLKLFRVNQSVVSNMGLPNEKEALNKTVFDIYPKSQADYLYEQECKIVETRKPLINDEVEIILPNGIKQWFSTTKVPIINEQGEVDGIIGVSRNITKQKDAEHQIKMATQRLEVKAAEMNAILDEIEEGVISTDHSCRITQVNNWFEQLIETPKEFLIGEHINGVLKSNFGIDILPVLKNVQMENLSEKTVVKFVLHDNDYALTLKPIQMNNVFMGVICCIHNLSELIDDSVIPKTYHNNTSVIESINTPILGMVEIADQLTKTNLTDEQKSMIDTIVNCGQSVLNLMPSKELNV